MNSRLTILALGAAMALASGPGLAQTNAPPISQGPAVPGLCVLGVGQAISDSTVGQYVNTRLQQLGGQVKAELQPEGDAITAEDRRLQAQRATLAAATLQSQAQALQGRLVAYQEKVQLRQREMEATQQKALNRIAQELDPIAKQLYQQHRCSALVDKNAVMLVNPEMDITAQAVTLLNARITQFPFERENLQAQAATTAPARR